MFPSRRKYVIVGAGIHGLSTAYHLAQLLKAKGRGDGRDIVILDKRGVAAGASGIACGVIRNNYYQPAMRELMAHSVQLWESDPEAYSYHPVGYIQLGPKAMREDIAGIARAVVVADERRAEINRRKRTQRTPDTPGAGGRRAARQRANRQQRLKAFAFA